MKNVRHISLALAAIMGLLCSGARVARATPRSWTGASSANWNTAGNWSPAGIPNQSDDVTIAGGSATINVDAAVDVNSITVNGACTRTIRASPVTTPIRIRGDLVLSSTSSGGVFRLGTGTTQIGGQLTRSNDNMTLDTSGGLIVFNAAAGSKTHTLSGATLDSVTINDGLVGYWKLDETSSPFADSSDYQNDATLTGSYAAAPAPTVLFSDPSAVTFNGTSNYLTLGTTNLPAANAAQTISVWVKFSGASSAQGILSLNGTGSAVRLGLGSGFLRVRKNSGTTLVQVASAGTWHHIAYVHDPSQSTPANRDKIYIEATASIGTGAGHDTGPPTATFIGATNASANHYTGSLEDVRVYNAALTPTQVTSLSVGRYAGTGGAATLTPAGGDTTIPPSAGSGCNGGQGYGLSLDSGSLYTSDLKLTVRLKSAPVLVNSGTLHIGSDIFNGDGGLTVNPMGTLLMDQSGGARRSTCSWQ